MSCILSVVIDRNEEPSLYQVLCLNPSLFEASPRDLAHDYSPLQLSPLLLHVSAEKQELTGFDEDCVSADLYSVDLTTPHLSGCTTPTNSRDLETTPTNSRDLETTPTNSEVPVRRQPHSLEYRLPKNVEFVFEDVLEFWKTYDYFKREHASTVSLNDENDGRLTVNISDAVSELETVKFTIQTKTALLSFSQRQMSVIRCHEEFIWLHDMLSENAEYAGYIIPPAPPKPDFEVARDKLTRVTAAENTMTEDEYKKLRKELESDYLALFKKTVAMHEIYLLRIAAHSKLREDSNFRVFLEYSKDLKVRSKNKKELIGGFFKSMTKNVDEALLSGQKDKDEFFIEKRQFLEDYHSRIVTTTKKSEALSGGTNNLSVDYMQVAGCLALLSTRDPSLQRFMAQCAISFETLQKLQKRISTDEDLKMTDLFRYYQRETQAAKSLLYRRGRALADKEIAEGKLEQAQKKFKDIPTAEAYLEDCKIRFETISEMAKTELETFKQRRLETYRKHLVDMSELQIRHSQSIITELGKSLELLKDL